MSEPPVNGVLDVILKNCEKYPDKPALHWLNKDGEVEEMVTYKEIEENTLRTARGLLALLKHYNMEEKASKHCVVLCYPPGLEFILTFIACLRAGLIAVPACPPSKHHSAYTTATLIKIITDCGAQFGFTNKEFCEDPSIADMMGRCDLSWHCELLLNDDNEEVEKSEELDENGHPRSPEYKAKEQEMSLDQTNPGDVILLQYTSGSTGSPKGVINTNQSVLHNLELMKTITKTSNQTIELSFLPHYHNFGLFCSYLQTLYCGATGYYMSPQSFIEEPGLWISCISKFKATHTQTPNFALELVLRKGYSKDIDLSCLHYISNGSEPIYADTIERFESELAPYGLRKNRVRVAYGLAEHTVYVCGAMDEEDPLVIDNRISCGKPLPGVTVKVVNPETSTEMSEGKEGEVWVESSSKSPGYWKGVDETFKAKLVDDPDKDYLHTGDLGFMKEGQLFISGRIKDVIVMCGRKIHPSDIEMRIESQFALLRPGRTIACEHSDTTNKTGPGVTYIAELRSSEERGIADLESQSTQIAAEISIQFQVNVKLVVLIKHGSMPRTTSGKRQRSLCKKQLLENSLPEVYRWAPSEENHITVHIESPSPPPLLDSPEPQPRGGFRTSMVGPIAENLPSVKTAFDSVSPSESKESKHWYHDITSQDLVKQFNFEMGEKSTAGDQLVLRPPPSPKATANKSKYRIEALRNTRHSSVERINFEIGHNTKPTDSPKGLEVPHLPKIEVEDIVIPKISDPDTTSPDPKVRKSSTVLPAITATSPKVSVKSFSGKPKLTSDSLDFLNVQDNPRRRSAPPHEVDMEGKRIKDELRRQSVQNRRTMLLKKERRNSLETLTRTINKALGVKLEPDSNIWAYGCNSVKAVELSKTLQLDFGFTVEPHLLYAHQTPRELLENLQERLLDMPQLPKVSKRKITDWKTQSLDRKLVGRRHTFSLLTDMRRSSLPKIFSDDGSSTPSGSSGSKCSLDYEPVIGDIDIAIVGMACSFADCDNTEELWKLLAGKQVATTSHLDNISKSTYNGGFSKSTGRFDHHFFQMSEWEASSLDPQHSMLLHSVWECLQNSGYNKPSEDVRGSDWGVYVGISLDCDAHFLGSEEGIIPPATNITSSVAANRIARMFDLVGPTMSIDTACASSLSALHTACLSLATGDCRAALVCGVNAMLDKHRFDSLDNMGMLAPDERCKVFDKKADGYVRGEGSGSVLLMPLWKAREERRRVLAVIKSTATNNNGASSSTLTAPHAGAQTKVLNKALSKPKIEPSQIRYVEAHGTGTRLGDPIEIDAIENVLGSKTTLEGEDHVYVGSVKANIGHLENGAGIAGLIKTVLVLEHAQVPGNPCLEGLNPAFQLSRNIQIPTDNVMQAFEVTEKVCAIVNSFGFGGTNATAVLQQFGVLPHMARVESGVLFLVDPSPDELPSIANSISTLEEKFPAFQRASKLCSKDTKGMEFTKNMAIFQLFYGIYNLFSSLGTEFNIAGGIDFLGEILMLTLTGAIEVSMAMTLVKSFKSGNYPSTSKIQVSISKPSVPIFSCVLEKVCQPGQFCSELRSEKYAQRLLEMLQGADKPRGPMYTKALIMMCSQTINTHPILLLAMDSAPTQLTEIEQSLPDNRICMTLNQKDPSNKLSLPQYIRESCLKLRELNDRLELEACIDKPLKGPQTVLPRFYEKYPLRALVDGVAKTCQQQKTETEVRGAHNESGYITQTASTESLETTTPVKSLTRAPPPSPSTLGIKLGIKPKTKKDLTESCIKALWKDEFMGEDKVMAKEILEVQEDPKDTPEKQKKEVLAAILKQVQDEVDDANMTLEELAESGIFELGLDSLNVMQLSDFFKKTYDIHFTYVELTELDTLGRIAETVVKSSSLLNKVTS